MNGEKTARRRLAALPGFTASGAEQARLTRLEGLTNSVFKVETDGEALCLRIPGHGTEAIVDRRREEVNARAAAAIGVTPEIVHFGEDGVMLTRFVAGAPLTPERLSENPGALERAATALRTLHQSAASFAGVFKAFETIDAYVALLGERGAALPARHRKALAFAGPARSALGTHPAKLRPCHCDPTGRNLIDTGERVWLVDWEYAAMNDPAWDLAYFSLLSGLDETADGALLTAYFGRRPRAAERARVAVTKAACELLAATWALVQEAQGNRVADFRGYAERVFAQAAERMAAPAFAKNLQALR
ncbi:MAG: phosphotransferase [Propylenella sp.]